MVSFDKAATVTEACNAILQYLNNHPKAADTQDGIGKWWLAGIHPKPSADVLQKALDELLAAGKIGCSRLVDGSIVYEKARDSRKQP